MIQTLDSVKKEAVDQGYQLLWQYNECVHMCAPLNTYNHVILLLFPKFPFLMSVTNNICIGKHFTAAYIV